MKARVIRSIIATGTALLMAGVVAAQSGGEQARHGGARRVTSSHATAVAALDGIGSVAGWGRIMVRDAELGSGEVQRVVTIHLLSLEPESPYTVRIDGLTVAEVTTDAHGDVQARLESPGDGLAPVPDALPPAIELMFAEVLDSSDAPTLEGLFVTSSFGTAGQQELVYFERIVLDSGADLPRGVAKVAVDAAAVETFDTRACGLEPGATYEVHVDGALAGIVTADVVGQGSLELASTGEGNLLPEDLGSVQGFRLVEWVHQAGGQVVLSGSFTGESMLGQGPLRDQQGAGGAGGGPQNGSGNGQGGGEASGGQQGGEGGPYGGGGDCDGSGTGGPHGSP